MTTKDRSQKDLLCRHFGAQGWYVQPEVPVFHQGGVHEQQKPITDIDVLALRPGLDLRWDLVLGDCKTLRGQSPVNRSIWLRGLMEHFSASSGIIVLRHGRPIEPDHMLFAASLGISLVEESEFKFYDQAALYPGGSADYRISVRELTEIRELPERYPRLESLCEYIYQLAWNEKNRLELLRRVIGEAQSVAREIDPSRPEHLALTLDTVGVFTIGLAECVGTIFSQYLRPETLEQLDDALKMLIWGGRSQYLFVAKLRHDLMVAKGKELGSSGALALPAWDRFLQLVRSMLEYPKLAFSVPQLLQRAAIEAYHEQPFLSHTTYSDLLLLKYSMLAATYFCRAANLPLQTGTLLEDKFIRRQSQLVHLHRLPDSSQAEEAIKEQSEELDHQQLRIEGLQEPPVHATEVSPGGESTA